MMLITDKLKSAISIWTVGSTTPMVQTDHPFPSSLSPVSAQLHSLIQLLPPSFSLSPTASGRGWPPATSSNGSEPAGARRRWPEVDLALAVEAAAWTLGAATSSS
jgi:hypothetical protein